MKKRIVSVALILALCLNMLPAGVFAAETDGTKTCRHHPEHTAECGYVEEVQGSSCTHEHTEACYEFVTECIHEHTDECYSDAPSPAPEEGGDASDTEQTDPSGEEGDASDAEQTDPSGEEGNESDAEQTDPSEEEGNESEAEQNASSAMRSASSEEQMFSESGPDQDRTLNCTHECSEESGCIVKELHCTHDHDDACGYVESVPGHPCEYVCRICPLQELIDALPNRITEENREDVIRILDEILEKYEALTEEEQEQVDLSRYEKLRDLLEEEEETEAPYDLFVIHSLNLDGDLYCGTELIELSSDDLKEEYDLHEAIMDKEGMEAVGASYYDEESGGLEESWTVSLSDFTEAGDPEDGSNYYAVQAVIEYGVADGYTAIVPEKPSPADDPYGIMPLVGFTGGNIEDITFEPANIVTVTVNYMYSPTGGLSGMPAAAPREYQIAVTKDTDAVLENVSIPNAAGGYPNLDGFRIVLDSKPLNAFLVNPALANEMSENPDPDRIKNALENDLFTIDTSKDVYYDKDDHSVNNPEKENPYSNAYNQAWDEARSITTSDYTAMASAGNGSQNLGATPLKDPELTVTIPKARVNQILETLKTDPDSETVKNALTVTVYYRRNAGEYTVNHWVPYLSSAEQTGKPQKEVNGVIYWNVYPETKQGRIGAMTNAISGMDQMDRTGVEEWLADDRFDFRPYVTQGFAQQIVASGSTTKVDIYYDSASEYRIIFDTSDTYIPRVSVNANDTLVFDYDASNGNGGNGSLTVQNSSGTAYPDQGAADYQNPARTGYRFSGWRYEVKENSGITGEYRDQTDGKWYVDVKAASPELKIEVDENKTTVIVLASGDANTVKAIHLYPIWEEASANVRVVFWTEDLGGAEKDVDVGLSNQLTGSSYIQNLGSAYLSGTPDIVGSNFSNVGSFTFKATTGDTLNLSVDGSGQSASLETTTSSTFNVTGDTVSGSLERIINEMFQKRMADVTPTAGDAVNSSVFYHPYAVMGADNNNFTVAADGSTVINVRYARNVYSLDFTYYGTVNSNTSIATNAKGYSGLNNPANYAAQRTDVAANSGLQNVWDRVTDVNSLTVPQKVTVKAKYGADLREVWPRTYSETIATTYGSGNNRNRTPTFTSWATTAGGYNQRFKNDNSQEPTIMGVYSAMDVDVIADPTDSRTTHHMYAYWCPSQAPSHYRFNHCFEIPDLTWGELTSAADTRSNNLRDKAVAGIGLHHDPQQSDERADTIYLVPVNGTLGDKFADYADVLLKVTPGNGSYTFGEASEHGTHYVVRRYASKNNVAQKERVYALARQVDAISTNTVKNQNPSARLHMERANDIPDHATNASDEAGRSTYDDPNATNEARRNNQIGTAENPYDLFFYYDRERMTITYMVPARDSDSGEYTLGTKEVPYGASLSRYDVQLDGNPSSAGNNGTPDNKRYSNDPKFVDFWEAAGTGNTGEGLQNGYARTAPNSAADGKGIWTFQGWSLDRALSQSADFTGMMSGNLRLFANWEEPKYQVTFELAGGVLADGSTGPIVESNLLANQGYTSNENADIPRPTQNGHTLTGWKWFEEDGVTEVSNFTFETPITRNMVAVAQWTTYDVKAYKYKVWYLTNDTDPVTRKTGEGWIDAQESGPVGSHTQSGTVNTTNYNKVLGCQFITGDYPKGTNLLLGAESFAGYIPYNGNASILLGNPNPDATAADTQYVAYFYYNKARMKKYTMEFQPVKIIDGSDDGNVLADITQEGETDQAYFTPSDENFKALREAGYQLVQMHADGTVVMENGKPKAARNVAELKAFIDAVNSEFAGKDDGETMTVIFKVMPVPYTIDYWVGTLVNGADRTEIKADKSSEISANTLAGRMQKALNDLEGDEISVAVPAGKNPTAYDVSYFRDSVSNNFTRSFTLKAPVYVQDPEHPAEWWKFTGWSLGNNTIANITARAVAGEYPTLEVHRSVGNLIFLANWERANAGLTVQCDVTTNSGTPERPITIPDEEFEYTLTLPAGTDPTSLFAYKTDQAGDITEFPIPAGWDGKFSLKNGETMSFGGLTGAYTVAQTKTGNLFDDTQKNYFKLIQVTADGSVVGNVAADGSETGAVISGSHDGTLGGGNLLDALIFTNEYMASADLDTDPDQAGNQGFPVTKYLLEEDADGNRTRRTFFGGNNYEFTIRAGAQSTAGTPVPDAIALRSTAGAESLSGAFDSVRFTKTGTYTYVIRESRPNGTGVPGVSYDPTRYRVTVEVTADDTDPSSLKTMITRVESRTTEDNSGGTDAGWTVIAGGAGDLEGSIEFNNVYNTTQINRTFQPTKVLTGRDTPLAAGEFTFTLTPAGSVNITQEQAQAYHNASTDEAKLNYLQGLDNNNLFTADNTQPMPGNVGADHKVTNGESGAVLINPITYTSGHMGNQRYGKVYKYTISEDVPAGAVDGKYNGMVYDTETRTLYVYVHLHTTDGALAALGDPDTLVYADVLGDRDATFTNTYETAPVTVDVGGDGDPAAGILGIPLVKQLKGRNFKAGDSFTFTLTADTPVDAPLPKNAAGEDVSQVTVTPTSGNRVHVLFGQLTFTQEGTYVYTLQEQPGDAKKMTYDTEPKTLTITVADDGEGRLTAVANPGRLTWINTYKDDSKKDPNKDPDQEPENDPGSDTGSDSGSDSGSGAADSDLAAVSAEGGAGGALPQTGMLWWPVWILVLLGVVMLGIGLVRKRSSRGEHEE